jgi:signal transduction histidine kinase
VRERNLPGLERAFTRASRRFPEVGDFYVVFFDRGRELETWSALHYLPPDANDPTTRKYLGVPIGRLIKDGDAGEALRRAWVSVHDRSEIAVYTVNAPVSLADARPRQIFFHPVYDSASMDRQDNLDRVGLIGFTANIETYPSPDYLRNLVARYENNKDSNMGVLGKLAYRVRLKDGGITRDLVSSSDLIEPLRVRGFESSNNLFPDLSFGAAPRDNAATADASEYAQSSILLGLGAATLSLIGLGLTWRATRREMMVAQLKSDFLASISHELKTPLTAIRAFGDLLHSGRARDSGRVREYGGMIKTESDRLTGLINNILEMSRLERNVQRYRLEEGSLSEEVAAIVEFFRHSAEAKGFVIEVELPSPPLRTEFNKSAIRQALLNLLSNAARYSAVPPPGSPNASRIEVAVRRDETDAIIEVRDFGIGIPKSEQRNIFTPFHRAPQAEAQTNGGTGLGLAVVIEVARAHGGKVSLESEPGKGATFRIHLPLLISSQEQIASRASGANLHGKYLSDRGRAKRRYRLAR